MLNCMKIYKKIQDLLIRIKKFDFSLFEIKINSVIIHLNFIEVTFLFWISTISSVILQIRNPQDINLIMLLIIVFELLGLLTVL